MIYCYKCGVELAEDQKKCPLCGTKVPVEAAGAEQTYPKPDPLINHPMNMRERQTLAFIIISILLIIPVLLVFAIDLRGDSRIDWAVVPMISILLSWIIICLPLVMRRLFWILYPVYTVSVSVFFLLLDFKTGLSGWSYKLAIPLTVSIITLITFTVLYGLKTKHHGLNLISAVLLFIGACSTVIDVLVKLYLNEAPVPGWSIIVVITAFPVAWFLTFLHRNPGMRATLRKKFHI